MGSGEKKIVAVLVVVLIGLVVAYVAFPPKSRTPGAGMTGRPMQAAGGASDASCATGTSSGGAGVATQEFGKKGAKLEIVAALPITHGCHVETEAELKGAYNRHEGDIHLTIYDLFGPEGQAYAAQHGGKRAVVFINGESAFELNGKRVVLEKMENQTYRPSDIGPIIEQVLKKS